MLKEGRFQPPSQLDFIRTIFAELMPDAVMSRGLDSNPFGFNNYQVFSLSNRGKGKIFFTLKNDVIITPFHVGGMAFCGTEFDLRNPSSLDDLNTFLMKNLKEN